MPPNRTIVLRRDDGGRSASEVVTEVRGLRLLGLWFTGFGVCWTITAC